MLNLLQANRLTLADLLPKASMVALRSKGRRARYADGQLIQLRGDTRCGFSLVESGQVLAGNVGSDGAFLTTHLISAGDYFGEFTLLGGLPRTQNLWAVGDTELTHVSEQYFQELFDRDPDLARALLTITLQRLHFMVEFLDIQRRAALPIRVVHLLMTSVPDRTRSGSIEVRCRQEDLAAMLGVSRVAVGKALKTLQHEGLVAPQYGSIVLPDVGRLAAWLEQYCELTPITPSKRLKGATDSATRSDSATVIARHRKIH